MTVSFPEQNRTEHIFIEIKLRLLTGSVRAMAPPRGAVVWSAAVVCSGLTCLHLRLCHTLLLCDAYVLLIFCAVLEYCRTVIII